MAGRPKKKAHLQSMIATGELPPNEDMIERVKWMIADATERYWDKRDELGPVASITCMERLCGLLNQLKSWGCDISEFQMAIMIPGFAPVEKSDESGD